MSLNIGMAARTDVFKVSTALITQRLFQGKPLDERLWIVSSALAIIGFIAYQLLVASWLDTSKLATGAAKVAVDDIIKFSTMFAVAGLLSGGTSAQLMATGDAASVSQEQWVKDAGLFIASLVTYDLLFHEMVAERTAHLDRTVSLAANDAIKFSVVFTVNNFAKGGEFDKAWFMSCGGFITGLVIYNVIVERYAGKYITDGKF
jgi:hypothetical protein